MPPNRGVTHLYLKILAIKGCGGNFGVIPTPITAPPYLYADGSRCLWGASRCGSAPRWTRPSLGVTPSPTWSSARRRHSQVRAQIVDGMKETWFTSRLNGGVLPGQRMKNGWKTSELPPGPTISIWDGRRRVERLPRGLIRPRGVTHLYLKILAIKGCGGNFGVIPTPITAPPYLYADGSRCLWGASRCGSAPRWTRPSLGVTPSPTWSSARRRHSQVRRLHQRNEFEPLPFGASLTCRVSEFSTRPARSHRGPH